ncbi:MAG: alpha-amylase family glycosyl hydrolase [Chryseolinea sp.]
MSMYNPVSTYRLQFNRDFTFLQAENIVEYLFELGIKTVYASPIFSAVSGSMHGYDVVNPFVVNPEIGTEDQLRRLIKKLKERGIGWIQDIVPNHMAYHTSNPWIMDIMEKGPLSPYSEVFDNTWSGDFHSGKPMAPFLGDQLEQVVRSGEISIVFHQYKMCLHYGDLYLPLNSRSYGGILAATDMPESVLLFVSQLDELHRIEDSVQYAFRWHELLLQFAAFMRDIEIASRVNDILSTISNDEQQLIDIAKAQFYRLCHWRETDERINYRRFFLVNGLICLNMQSEKVFSLYHERIVSYVKDRLFQGLRIDHIDGLFDPTTYLQRLRKVCGAECYIIVEKILEQGEHLEKSWPIQGTTGYEFLSAVNNLFTRSSAENRFSKFYRSLNPEGQDIADRIREKKQFILDHHMQGELDNLARYFVEHLYNASEDKSEKADFEPRLIRDAIASLMIELPVYRFYGNELPFDAVEKKTRRGIVEQMHE